MKGIVLCSGGLDSTLALIKQLELGLECVPMFINYNQWPSEGEHEAFHNIVAWCKTTWPSQVLDAVEPQISLGDDEGIGSVWGRGIALVGIASMWAYTHDNDYDFIALGNHQGDVGPDCKPGSFDHQLNTLLFDTTKGKLSLSLPIRSLSIGDIGKELASYDKKLFELTYSCYWGPPCGYKSANDSYRCPGCRRKVMAMEAAAQGNSGLQEFFQERLYQLPNCESRSYQSPRAERVEY